ncbi:FGGY family carbohydrate kinase [Mesorhizobium sp. VK9D]|uniref:FGGY family carbohydrate kinase n=1 Tax=Mesorhizobium australafricanum TaxID=3072311 RepID=UPI002A23ECD1|nr:FGGY family carbohydrate kinase [Mesorhizobium sp. VK9D]MDX8454263.1 FGGY family carbohydrate kinase [Mesorhizobium sp. VK9D]
MGRYVLAIDAGTGSGRAIVYDLKGAIVSLAQEEWSHPAVPDVPGGFDFAAEVNGALVDRVIGKAIHEANLSSSEIAAVSTTSMREGVVLYDAAGTVLWACPNVDARAQAEANELVREGIAQKIYETAGDWVSITAPARLKWLQKRHPDLASRARHIGLISDWLATRLTGTYYTEPSVGSSSALFDLSKRSWSMELVEAIGLDPAIMPPVVEPGTVVGRVMTAAAQRCGLAAGTPVIAGGADTQLALFGLGRRAGDATLVGGSFWQTTILANKPLIDPKRSPRTLCHVQPGEWMVEGIGFLTGFSMRWLRDAFVLPLLPASERSKAFQRMEELATAVPPGCEGVYATMANPMQADRWLHPAPGFLGFNINRADVGIGAATRGIMEAGAFIAHDHLKTLKALSGYSFERIQFTGGSSQGALWPQIIADVFGLPVDIPVVKETTALGCAMLAAVGAGLFKTLDEAVSAMASPVERQIEPAPEKHEAYSSLERQWMALNGEITKIANRGLVEPLWRPAGALT